ncbi:hypothetical protein V2J09_016485 [Rumex salicifolius]
MVRPKSSSKKQPSRGVDFKKFKRKIGRELPPAKNATNTEIKTKAIILPEQSVAADKTGLAVSRKGLTLKELLQQTSHHNAKVRRDAIIGIKDLLQRHPEELKLHRLSVIEKLRERISDDDKVVRETLYQLFKSVILPGCKEDNLGALVSLIMVYVFNAMTNLSIDVRLLAFKFLDLLVQHHPLTFTTNAEKILQNYEDILRKNKFHLEDKGKLKIALSGLMCCLSLLPSYEKEDPSAKNIAGSYALHAYKPDVQKDSSGYLCVVQRLKDVVPVLVNCFNDFLSMVHAQPQLDGLSYDCILSILQSIDYAVCYFAYGELNYQQNHTTTYPVKNDITTLSQSFTTSLEKLFYLFPLRLVHHASEKDDSRYFTVNAVILKIFFNLSKRSCPPPTLLDRFLEFVEFVLLEKISRGKQSVQAFSEKHLLSLISSLPRLVSGVDYSWRYRLIQAFTATFERCSSASKMKMACLLAIEEILLPQNMQHLEGDDPNILAHQSTWIQELPLILVSLGDTHPSYSKAVLSLLLRLGQVALPNTFLGSEYDKIQPKLRAFFGDGLFVRLPDDCQELSCCCLYYFSLLDASLLTSIASCCLCHDLDLNILFRMIEVLNSAYKAGHIQMDDQISFFITLLSQLKVRPGLPDGVSQDAQKFSTRQNYRSITGAICSFLHQMGDHSLMFQMLENILLDILSAKLALDNTCSMIRMLVTVYTTSTQLSAESLVKLSNILSGYLLDIAICFPEEKTKCSDSAARQAYQYYLLPCLVMLDRSHKLLKSLLVTMGSLVFANELDLCHNFSVISGDPTSRIRAFVSIFSMLFKDVKIRRALPSFKQEMDAILTSIVSLQSKEELDMGLEQRHKAKSAVEELEVVIGALVLGV